ncbi:MAG: M50 family metallopeptidase [Candidatus Lokiarchaeota archaeon]|nr:M50 family metallopeptidase [Candidatus Lokiarchaeota archaeon]
MKIDWLITISLLFMGLIIGTMILIDKKKKALLITISLVVLHNCCAILSSINAYRRDYNYDINLFPLLNYLLYFILYNASLMFMITVYILNFKRFNENQIIRKAKNSLKRISSNFFKPKTTLQKVISIGLLLCFVYILGFLTTLVHEFGHSIARVLCGGYYEKIEINFFLGGRAYSAGGSYTTQYMILSNLSGLLAEVIVGSVLFAIFLLIKRRNRFWTFSVLNVLTTLFIHGVGYFTIYSVLDTHSDARTLSNILNISPITVFWITLPFFIGIIIYSLIMLWKFYKNFFKPQIFFPAFYFICILILYWYEIFFSLVINPYNLPFLTIV